MESIGPDKTTSVIGFGSFGKVLVDILLSFGFERVLVYDLTAPAETEQIKPVDFETAARAELVWVAVPFSSFAEVIKQVANVTPATSRTVIDVLSVKEKPAQLMLELLPETDGIIASHPLFGPQSYTGSLAGLKWVLRELRPSPWTKWLQLQIQDRGGQVYSTSPSEHDEQMAIVHALTFFISRSLLNMDLAQSELATAYSSKLLELVELEKHHSLDLFMTIESANPYAQQIREQFLEVAQELDRSIDVL